MSAETEIVGDFWGLCSFSHDTSGSCFHIPTIAILARDLCFDDMEEVKRNASQQLISSLNNHQLYSALLFIERDGTVHVFKAEELLA